MSLFSGSVVSDSLQPHGLQHTRFPFLRQLPELAQTHVHRVGNAIQPPHPLSSPSPPAFNLSQHQSQQKLLVQEQQSYQFHILEDNSSNSRPPRASLSAFTPPTVVIWAFLVVSAVRGPPASEGEAGSTPGSGRSPGEGTDNPLQYSHLGNPKDRGAGQAIVHVFTKESGTTEQLNYSVVIVLDQLVSIETPSVKEDQRQGTGDGLEMKRGLVHTEC